MVSYYCAYARETISKIKGKYITQVYRTQWYSENKTKHKKIMCIFHGIHCVIFIMEIRGTNCHCQFLFMVAGLWWTFFWFRCCIHLIHNVFTRVEATLFTVHKSGNEKDVSSRYTKSPGISSSQQLENISWCKFGFKFFDIRTWQHSMQCFEDAE